MLTLKSALWSYGSDNEIYAAPHGKAAVLTYESEASWTPQEGMVLVGDAMFIDEMVESHHGNRQTAFDQLVSDVNAIEFQRG